MSHIVTAVVSFGFGIAVMSARGKQLLALLIAKTKVL
jgi:hypothetical protein